MKRDEKQHILVEHYLDFYSRAMAILDDEDDAKDAVQEAIAKTLARIGVHNPFAYCLRATANESINLLRRRQRHVKINETMLLASYEQERIAKVINESKDQLQPLERLVLEFHREDGYTLARLAAILGISVSSVKRLLANADRKMKKTIYNSL